MSYSKQLILFLSIFFSTSEMLLSQPKLTLKSSWHLSCNSFNCDSFGNLYSVSNFQIEKFDSLGKRIALYDQSTNGKIGAIDITNPLKIMIFYPDRNKVLFFDRNLAPMDPSIDLSLLFDETISLCCNSNSNGLWCYSQNGSKLFRISQQGEITSTFDNLNQWLPTGFAATQLIEIGDYLYMGDPNNGIIVFDRWGSIIHKIPNLYQGTFSVVSELIFYHRENKVFYYNPKNFEESILYQASDKIKQCVVLKSNLIIQIKNDSIFKFSID